MLSDSVVGSEEEAVEVEYLDNDDVDTTTATADAPSRSAPVSRGEFINGTEDSQSLPTAPAYAQSAPSVPAPSTDSSSAPDWLDLCRARRRRRPRVPPTFFLCHFYQNPAWFTLSDQRRNKFNVPHHQLHNS